jgi:CRP-like cAMP-binding protein
MPDRAVTPTEAIVPVVSFREGQYVFRAGEPAGAFFIIQAGQVELLRRGSEERLALLDAGDPFGEDSAFDNQVRAYDARTITAVRLIRVDGESFTSLIRVHPEVATRLIGRVGLRLLQSRGACLALARPTVGMSSAGRAASRQPRLIHVETGSQFQLPATGDAIVGRADPRTHFEPDIELSGVDTHRSLSRRHVRVTRKGDEFFVVEEPKVANGTFVNGQRLSPGVPVAIKDGDEISVGLIRTIFRTT